MKIVGFSNDDNICEKNKTVRATNNIYIIL